MNEAQQAAQAAMATAAQQLEKQTIVNMTKAAKGYTTTAVVGGLTAVIVANLVIASAGHIGKRMIG